jgi:hypothetical protein
MPEGAGPAVVNSTPMPVSRFQPVQLFQPEGALKAERSKQPPPTTVQQIAVPKYLRKRVDVKPVPAPDKPAPPEDPADHRPKPGDAIAVDDHVAAERAAAATAREVSILRYVIVGMSGKRLGTPTSVLEVPLTTSVAPPGNLQAEYDEASLKLSWTGGSAAETFQAYRAVSGREDGPPLNAAPLTSPSFSVPVEFGVERCFLVRTALARGLVTVESEPSPPLCVKAADTFPPAAPTGLSLLPTETSNQLTWTAVATPDLAGYVVMRAEEGIPARALTTDVLTETSYTDRTVKSGAHYTYTVVAVDKAGNRSAPSNPAEDIR